MCSDSVLLVHFLPETLAKFLKFSLDQVCRHGRWIPFSQDPGDEDTTRGVEQHQAGRGHSRSREEGVCAPPRPAPRLCRELLPSLKLPTWLQKRQIPGHFRRSGHARTCRCHFESKRPLT